MRRSPLKPGKPLTRGKPLERGATPLARTPMKRSAKRPTKPARKTGATRDVRQQAVLRDEGRCQRCGVPGTNLQHREGRGAGGRGTDDAARTNGVEWLVLVCGQGNASGCHKAIDEDRERAEREGYVIRRNATLADAAAVPVKTYRGWFLLTPGGTRVRTEPPETV